MILDFTEIIITAHCETKTEFSWHERSLVTHHLPFRGLILGHLLYINKHPDLKFKSIYCGLNFKCLRFPITESLSVKLKSKF